MAAAESTLFAPDLIARAAENLEGRHPEEIVAWAIHTYHPGVALACSFGMEDVALVHMIAQVRKDARLFYLDTDLLFPQTYATRDRLIERYGVTPERVTPRLSLSEQAEKHGDALWQRDPNACCGIRKVEPLGRVLSTLDAWITGIRRDQTPQRANARVVEWDARHGLVKVNPLAAWTFDDVAAYVRANDIPYNPLHDQGYPSIGCTPCTRAVAPGEDPRAGRWAGFQKTECGLHADA
jgi:phosphoadenosine phosphosulfate reductase